MKPMKPRVLINTPLIGDIDPTPLLMLEAAGCDIVHRPLDRLRTEEELAELVPGMDALIVGDDPVTAWILRKADRLRVIAKYGVGVDAIDVAEATRLGIAVTNSVGANREAVADSTMAMLL